MPDEETVEPPIDASASEVTRIDPAWAAAEIDRYLLALAKEVCPILEDRWIDFVAAIDAQSTEGAELREEWQPVVDRGPTQLSKALLLENEAGSGLRRIAPLFSVLPRDRREAVLRDAALSGPNAEIWRRRWDGDRAEETFLDSVVAHLLAATETTIRDAFTDFVAASARVRWIIAADFVLGDATRPNDVFAFTVFPDYARFDELNAEIGKGFPKDLKATKTITPEMVAALRSRRRFHFTFVVNKDRKLFKDVEAARAAIDQTVTMMLGYRDVERHRERIAEVKELRQRANAANFNSDLLQDLILMAAFGGFIATLLQMEGRAEVVGLFPDRDKMTTAYGAIAYPSFAINASSFALRRCVPEAQVILGFPGDRSDGKRGLYYDELLRLPDFIAGAIAATDLGGAKPKAVNRKSMDIVAKALTDNQNVAIFKVDLPPQVLSASVVSLTSTPVQ